MGVDENTSDENVADSEEAPSNIGEASEEISQDTASDNTKNPTSSEGESRVDQANESQAIESSEELAADNDNLETEIFPEEESLEEAYDFESGELIDDDPHAGIPSKNNVKSVREFFNTEVLYRFDILEDHERANLKGSYKLEILGDDKAEWFVELSDDPTVKSPQSKNDAESDFASIKPEVTISMKERDFILIVNGELNPQLAFLSEKVKVKGSIEKAMAFQVIIAPGFE